MGDSDDDYDRKRRDKFRGEPRRLNQVSPGARVTRGPGCVCHRRRNLLTGRKQPGRHQGKMATTVTTGQRRGSGPKSARLARPGRMQDAIPAVGTMSVRIAGLHQPPRHRPAKCRYRSNTGATGVTGRHPGCCGASCRRAPPAWQQAGPVFRDA